jgi:hypothetical protein
MIMYAIEIVEEKDAPPQRHRDPNERLGKTVGLLLPLCKSIYSRGFVVILDSGLCVLRGIIEFWKKGVFAVAVIKKCKYIYKPLSGIGISYGIFHPLLCDFKPELWQVHWTILAYFWLILGLGSLNKCYTSETRSHNYGSH